MQDVHAPHADHAEPSRRQVASILALPETAVPIIEYANGLRFSYLPTDIYEGHVELLASSPGGWTTLGPADVAEAKLLGDLMLASGVAGFDQVALDRFLAGTDVYLARFVDEVEEGFYWYSAA